jgi:hypothetical protein
LTKPERRVAWGTAASDHRGWLQVSPDPAGSRLMLYLVAAHGDARDSEVMGTPDAIR